MLEFYFVYVVKGVSTLLTDLFLNGLSVLPQTHKNCRKFGHERDKSPLKQESKLKIQAQLGLSMPKTPFNTVLCWAH